MSPPPPTHTHTHTHMDRYNEKADIWSLGITALELLKGHAPYSDYAPMQVLVKTINEAPPSLRSYADIPGVPTAAVSDKFAKFVSRCLQKDARLRFVGTHCCLT